MLPDTTTGRRAGRRCRGPILAACCATLLVVAAFSVVHRDFAPGEELGAPGVEDVAVSRRATDYPESDALRFDAGIRVVHVYLRLDNLATEGELEARVQRSGRGSALARLFRGDGLRVTEGGSARPGASDGRVSGIVRFAVRTESGGPLPAGDYTVGVYAADGSAGAALAKKYFVVGH